MSAVVKHNVDEKKRRFLVGATALVGGAAGVALAVPLAGSFFPSARARAAGAPVEVDVSKIEPGMQLTVEWRGAPVWVLYRTQEMLDRLSKSDALLADPQSNISKQPDYAKNPHRSRDSRYLVVKGVCTHLGCSPILRKEIAAADLGSDWPGGYFCPCHQSKFDLSARVFKGMPAPKNLEIPPYTLTGATLIIGDVSQT